MLEYAFEEPSLDMILLSSLWRKEVDSSNCFGIILLGVYSDCLYP